MSDVCSPRTPRKMSQLWELCIFISHCGSGGLARECHWVRPGRENEIIFIILIHWRLLSEMDRKEGKIFYFYMESEMPPLSLKSHIIYDVSRKIRWTFGYQLLWEIGSPKPYSLICPIGARINFYCVIFRKRQKFQSWLYRRTFVCLETSV